MPKLLRGWGGQDAPEMLSRGPFAVWDPCCLEIRDDICMCISGGGCGAAFNLLVSILRSVLNIMRVLCSKSGVFFSSGGGATFFVLASLRWWWEGGVIGRKASVMGIVHRNGHVGLRNQEGIFFIVRDVYFFLSFFLWDKRPTCQRQSIGGS